jgi:REP element-mobilizing transposase RayT
MFDMSASNYRTHRLRAGRYSRAGQIYLITAVTISREPVFKTLRYGRCVVKALQQAQVSADTLSFVVMPDHLHWLMQLREGYTLSKVVKFVKCSSAHSINRLRNTRGAVWSKGFHDRALKRDDDVAACARYVAANPLRAGLVEHIGDYPLWDAVWL